MGLDLQIYLDITDGRVDLPWLRARLEATAPPWLARTGVFRCPEGRWVIERSPGERVSDYILGSGGILSIDEGVLRVFSGRRWASVICDRAEREAMRIACHELARWVGSPRVFYGHELLPVQGGSLAEYENSLGAEIGPAARSFDEMCRAEDWSARCWIVEPACSPEVLEDLEAIRESAEFNYRSGLLTDRWRAREVGAEATEPVLRFMEASPDVDFGMPGGLVHFIEESLPGSYGALLLSSLERRPTAITVWMLSRLINGTEDKNARQRFIEAMRAALAHPLIEREVREKAREFLG